MVGIIDKLKNVFKGAEPEHDNVVEFKPVEKPASTEHLDFYEIHDEPKVLNLVKDGHAQAAPENLDPKWAEKVGAKQKPLTSLKLIKEASNNVSDEVDNTIKALKEYSKIYDAPTTIQNLHDHELRTHGISEGIVNEYKQSIQTASKLATALENIKPLLPSEENNFEASPKLKKAAEHAIPLQNKLQNELSDLQGNVRFNPKKTRTDTYRKTVETLIKSEALQDVPPQIFVDNFKVKPAIEDKPLQLHVQDENYEFKARPGVLQKVTALAVALKHNPAKTYTDEAEQRKAAANTPKQVG